MFSICRSDQTRRGLACLAAILLGMVACSREQDTAQTEPMVEAQSAAPSDEVRDILFSEITAGGVEAKYRAAFVNDQLRFIMELRAPYDVHGADGEYEFQGARLMSYAGTALNGAGAIEIRFNLQGAVTMSRAASGEVAPEEIAAIRARAQLLRSHALAQRATRTHETR